MKQKFKKLYLILVIVLQSTSSFADLQSEFQQAYQSYNQYVEADDIPLALGAAADAYKLGSKFYGKNHLNSAKLAINYASLLNETGEYKKAAKTLRGKLELMEEAYGENAKELVAPLLELGSAHINSRKSEEAIGYFQRASNILNDNDNPLVRGKRNFDIVVRLLKRQANQHTRPFVEASYIAYKGTLQRNDVRWGLANYHMAIWALQDESLTEATYHLNASLDAFKTSDDQMTTMERNLRIMLIDALQRTGNSASATEHCLAIGERSNWIADPLYIRPPNFDSVKIKQSDPVEIKLSFTVDEKGFVKNPKIESSSEPNLNNEALAALAEFRYAPRFSNGVPIATEDIKFTISYEAPPKPKFTRPPVMGLKSAGDEKSGGFGDNFGGFGVGGKGGK